MTFAQFRHMKPKYKIRLILTCAIALALCIGILLGISAGFSAIRRQLSTSSFSDMPVANVLLQSNMNRLAEAMKQNDPDKLLVLDSRLVCDKNGVPLEFEMNLVSLVGSNASDYWRITSTSKKTVLRKVKAENKSAASLAMRKLRFTDYYPALSRTASLELMQYLQGQFPVGNAGHYIFIDQFDDNLDPQYSGYLAQDMKGLWVSKISALSEFSDAYVPVSRCTPMVVSTEAENKQKSKPKRPVLLPAEEVAVLLLESGPYVN